MRLKWLDGLKGFACFAVLWHHFILAFLPGQFNGEMSTGSFFDPVQTPLSFIVNGNFMVAIFMVASGVVAALSVMNIENKNKFSSIVRKRYFRLMLPVIPVAIVTWIFSHFNLFLNRQAAFFTNSAYMASWYSEPLSLTQVLASGILTSWYKGDGTISGVFWVFPYFLFGFYLAILLAAMAWNKNKFNIIIYLFIAVLFGIANCYYLAFVLGVIIAYSYKNYAFLNSNNVLQKVVAAICVAIGLFLGGFPSYFVPTNIYRLLPSFNAMGIESYILWHVLGAALLIFGIWNLDFVKAVFEKGLFINLGQISYSVFLTHMLIVCTVTSVIFRVLIERVTSYNLAVLITFLATNLIVYIVSGLYNKFIELPLGKLVK